MDPTSTERFGADPTLTEQSPAEGRSVSPDPVVAFALHDARSLVAALSANLDWLKNASQGADSHDQVVSTVREMSEVCSHLTRLLTGALGACSTPATQINLDIRPVLVVEFVEASLMRTAGAAAARNVQVKAQGTARLVTPMDEGLMSRVLDTLIDNALSATPEGGTVLVEFDHFGSNLVLSVSDEGPGVSELARRHVFDPFWGTEDPSDPSNAALIGLAFCRAVLQEHRGYLDLESGHLGGSCFYLSLPGTSVLPDSVQQEALEAAAAGELGTFLAALPERVSASAMEPAEEGAIRRTPMNIKSDRFGELQCDKEDLIHFPFGIIGFPDERDFVLLRTTSSEIISWLQSASNPALSLPVVSAHCFGNKYPDVDVGPAARGIGIEPAVEDDLAIMAVLSAPPGQPATVNLLAPILVDAGTRRGAQVLLEGTQFTTRELFVTQPQPVPQDERMAAAG